MTEALVPILTLLVGQLLGYWFATRQTSRRIVAEKRAEFVSRFIGQAYGNLGYLATKAAAASAGTAGRELAILGDQAAFFLSDRAAAAIDELTKQFVISLTDRLDPDPDDRRDPFRAHKDKLDSLRTLLRRELQVHGELPGPRLRLPGRGDR